MAEMVRLFDITDVNKSAAAFDPAKLAWLNQQHMMRVPAEALVEPLRWQLAREGIAAPDDAQLAAIASAQRERSKTLREMAQNSLFFFRAPQAYDEKAVAKHVPASIFPMLEQLLEALRALEDWSAPAVHQRLTAFAEGVKLGLGKIAQPVRIAVSGATVSPPIDQTLCILGRTETLARLERAISHWRR